MKKICFFILLSVILGCNNEEKNEINTNVADSTINNTISEIFYSIPSPIEIGNIVELQTVDSNWFLPADSSDKFSSEKAIALNLGIYAADLSFIIFKDYKTLLPPYTKTVRNMMKRLDLGNKKIDSLIKDMETSFDDTNLVAKFSNLLYNSDAHLKETGQSDQAAYVAFGSWIEANYLLLKTAQNSNDPLQLYKIIADQRLVSDNIIKIMDTLDFDALIKNGIIKINNDLQAMVIKKTEQKIDDITGDTLFKTTIEYNIDNEKIKNLYQHIDSLRKQIIILF